MRSPVAHVIVALLLNAPLSAQITIDPFAPASWCAGNSVVLPFTAIGAYNPGNIFTAELSDASGSFASPLVIGSVAGTASGSVTCTLPNGIAGTAFRVRVSSDSPVLVGIPNSSDITIEAPNAGIDGFATICGNLISAMPFLGGAPDAGGVWSFASGTGVWISGDQFSADNGDVLQYTVITPGGCMDVAQVTVIVVQAPNAGSNATITVCSNDAPFSLFAQLGGTPNAGGAWTNPAANPAPLSFIPGTSIPGCYTYAVTGSAPCASDTSIVCVSVNQAPNAGSNASVTTCASAAPFSLFTYLGGTPQTGGTWSYPGGPYSGVYNPAVDLPGCFVYTVPGTPPCANASATVCVTEVAAPNAGIDGMITVCSAGPAVDLFVLLGGSAQPGGTWSAPLDATGGFYDPATMSPGIYSYTVDLGSCGTDAALINVLEVAAADAGTNGSFTVCEDGAPFLLFDQLGGTPQPGGAWTGPSPAPGGIYTAGSMSEGCYTYTVTGMAPCADASSQMCVTEIVLPNAGTGGSVAWCQSFGNIELFAQLGGAPQAGGTWTDDNTTGALSGSVFAAGSVPPGSYAFTYTVDGPPCSPATATVTVVVGPCLIPPGGFNPVE